MIVQKDIFRPGEYRLPDGREVKFTAADVRRAYENGLAMLRNRFAIPAIYEHDEHATPVQLSGSADPNWPESFARKAVGHVTGFSLREEGGVPVLWASHEIPEEDAKQWAKARFASPRLDVNASDSKGNRYPGYSVQHVAITPRPIQVEQSPVQLSTTAYTAPIYLSMEYLKMADENDDKGGSDTGGGEFKRVKDALSSMGHTLPDSVTDWNGLATALEVLAANGGATEPDDMDDMDDQDGDGTGETTAAAPPIMMSAQQQKVHERLVNAERRSLATRAETATRKLVARGLLTADQASKFNAKFTSVSLSFASDGSVKRNELVAQLETYEQLAANAKRTGNSVNLSNTTVMPQPQINGRDPKTTEQRQKDAADLIMSMTARAKK
jgi:hypothetical protein